jgi:hypothetical protein
MLGVWKLVGRLKLNASAFFSTQVAQPLRQDASSGWTKALNASFTPGPPAIRRHGSLYARLGKAAIPLCDDMKLTGGRRIIVPSLMADFL